MRVTIKILTLSVIAGTSILISTSASAWWNNDDDYWDEGPWGYPVYGWGGYPGYGWGGYPGYGWGGYPGYGWGGYPGYGGWWQRNRRIEIYTEPQDSGSSESYRIE